MPTIRLPKSAESLLQFCRRSTEPADNACFETFADLTVFAAACGYHRLHGRKPSEPKDYLTGTSPIDLGIFKNQGLFPNLLLIGLGTEGKPDIARDEERLCRLVEAFADVGCKYLANELVGWSATRFHCELALLLTHSTRSDSSAGI